MSPQRFLSGIDTSSTFTTGDWTGRTSPHLLCGMAKLDSAGTVIPAKANHNCSRTLHRKWAFYWARGALFWHDLPPALFVSWFPKWSRAQEPQFEMKPRGFGQDIGVTGLRHFQPWTRTWCSSRGATKYSWRFCAFHSTLWYVLNLKMWLCRFLIQFTDPVFFLHHTQLDRLCWRWQHADPQQRLTEYLGKAAQNSTESASLEDVLPMGNLAPDVQVSEIMATESELLCYRY